MILLRCISYILSFNDMFRLQLYKNFYMLYEISQVTITIELLILYFTLVRKVMSRSQCPRGLRHRSSATSLLRLWVRIPLGHKCLSVVNVVLSGRGLCDGLITRPEESYRLWCVVVCDVETSKTRRVKARYGAVKIQPQWAITPGKQTRKVINLKMAHNYSRKMSLNETMQEILTP